jgi:hypothetical protein
MTEEQQEELDRGERAGRLIARYVQWLYLTH